MQTEAKVQLEVLIETRCKWTWSWAGDVDWMRQEQCWRRGLDEAGKELETRLEQSWRLCDWKQPRVNTDKWTKSSSYYQGMVNNKLAMSESTVQGKLIGMSCR